MNSLPDLRWWISIIRIKYVERAAHNNLIKVINWKHPQQPATTHTQSTGKGKEEKDIYQTTASKVDFPYVEHFCPSFPRSSKSRLNCYITTSLFPCQPPNFPPLGIVNHSVVVRQNIHVTPWNSINFQDMEDTRQLEKGQKKRRRRTCSVASLGVFLGNSRAIIEMLIKFVHMLFSII